MVENMSNVLAQTDGLVVVDNGSKIDEISPLRKASQNHGFQLIENDVNLGIAEALNQGVRWARANGFSWVILFDQDSRLTPGFIGNIVCFNMGISPPTRKGWDPYSHDMSTRRLVLNPRCDAPATAVRSQP